MMPASLARVISPLIASILMALLASGCGTASTAPATGDPPPASSERPTAPRDSPSVSSDLLSTSQPDPEGMSRAVHARMSSPENPASRTLSAGVTGEITDEAEFQRQTYQWMLRVSQYEERVATELAQEFGVSRDSVVAAIDELQGRGAGRR